MNLEQKLAELEALLFIYGEPLSREKVVKMLDLPQKEASPLLEEFEKRLQTEDRGLALISDSGKIQLVTKPAFGKFLENIVKEELSEDLTPASLEVLSIVAYLGPISRSEIEYRRGVNSSFTLRNLLLRGLLERFADPNNPAAYLYQLSFELFKHLGLSKKEELPDYEKFRSLLLPIGSEKKVNTSLFSATAPDLSESNSGGRAEPIDEAELPGAPEATESEIPKNEMPNSIA